MSSGFLVFVAGACTTLLFLELGARRYWQALGTALVVAGLLAAAAL
jgi:hypothetical protein